MNRIFVYGTLMTGMDNYHLIQPFVRSCAPAVMRNAMLYDLTYGYPALVLAKGPCQVYGEIMELADIDRALAVLDRLEDYFGEGCQDNLYDRLVCEVYELSGRARDAYVYVWSRPGELATVGRPVESGCWRSFKQG
ncbi:MAG: gamma-glutamylcyclotransferase [Negativicutes bacterium]|nr:gamma-glutamylcyclotransferase [Negativicutes bacterium]